LAQEVLLVLWVLLGQMVAIPFLVQLLLQAAVKGHYETPMVLPVALGEGAGTRTALHRDQEALGHQVKEIMAGQGLLLLMGVLAAAAVLAQLALLVAGQMVGQGA
jgi:hypothetical protein